METVLKLVTQPAPGSLHWRWHVHRVKSRIYAADKSSGEMSVRSPTASEDAGSQVVTLS